MILRILNLHRIKELRGCNHALSLVDEFVGITLEFTMELEREKSHQVFRYYREHILYLVCQKVCIWDDYHDLYFSYRTDKFVHDLPYFWVNCNGTPHETYSYARNDGDSFRHNYFRYDLKDVNDPHYLSMYKFRMERVRCSYLSLFHSKKSKLGRVVNVRNGFSSSICHEIQLECNCYLCNHLQVV